MFRPERLAAFCDGVIAISITLLVLGLVVPSVRDIPDQQLYDYLSSNLHPLIGYVISFALIGMFWMQHYVIFHYIERVDRLFVFLNCLFLFCITFIPFPTGLHAVYRENELATIIYGVTVALTGLSLLAIWRYATDRHLVRPELSRAVIRSRTWQIMVIPLVSIAAIGLSLLSITLSRAIFLAIPMIYLMHRVADEEYVPPKS